MNYMSFNLYLFMHIKRFKDASLKCDIVGKRRQLQSTLNNSNPPQLETRVNLNQNRFSLDFLHTLTKILP